jgi:hypothetical protein
MAHQIDLICTVAEPGPQCGFDSLAELLERQAAREKVLAKRDDSLLAVGVRRARTRRPGPLR